jgi:O-antigen/teichoic acid export membrane protein
MFIKIRGYMMGNGGLRTELSRGALGNVAVKIISLLLGFFLMVLLARTLGPEGYGVYAFFFALVSLLAIPAQIGMPNLIVRETAKLEATEQWGLMLGLWRWSTSTVLLLSLGILLISSGLAWLLLDQFSSLQLKTFAFSLLLVPFIALSRLRTAAIQGLRKVILSQLPDFIIRPALLILLIVTVKFLFPAEALTSASAMGLYVIAAFVALLISIGLLRRVQPNQLKSKPNALYEKKYWFSAVLPLAFISGMVLITQNTDILMLGLFSTPENTGIYRAVISVSGLVAFGLYAVTIVVTPYFARFYAQGSKELMQKVVTQSARAILFLAIIMAIIIITLGEEMLGIFFGDEYLLGYLPLVVLAVGQLVNAFMGSVAGLLNMTGHEKETAKGVAIAAGVNVLLNLILIPYFGMSGAATATAVSLMVWNLLLWRAVHRHLDIESMAFRFFSVKAIK